MLLWLGFTLLAGATIAALMWPMLRSPDEAVGAAAADVAVYHDQLNSIAAERDRGLLNAEEAEAARTELARRLLRASEGQGAGSSDPSRESPAFSRSLTAKLAFAVLALVPIGSVAVYLPIGAPGLSGHPHAARSQVPAAGRSLDDLVGMVEARLRQQPDDAQGWEVIAPVYTRAGRYRDAANAYGNAIRLLGESPKRLLGLSEALILAENGLVTPDARKYLQRLLEAEPGRTEGVFWLAMAKEQDGDAAGAVADLSSLLAAAPADAPWRSMIETRINELKSRLAAAATPPGPASDSDASRAANGGRIGAPTDQDIAAAAQLSAEQRKSMIEGMVQGLADRLEKDGSDVEGWKKLLRAYKVLGRDDDARSAMAKARQALARDEAALKTLGEFAATLGLGS